MSNVILLKGRRYRRHGFRVDALAKELAHGIARWLKARAKYERDKAIAVLRGRREIVKREKWRDQDLLEILVQFGLRQVSASGKRTTIDLGGEWVLPPSLISDVISEKRVLVQRLLESIREDVRNSLRTIMDQAHGEYPQPSVGEIARRIRTQFHGSGGGYARGPLADVTESVFGILPTELQRVKGGTPLYAFSPERAALIARTESAQNENTGIFQGMKLSGVEYVEWLSSRSGNHGDRAHNLMDGEIVAVGKYFTTPLGNRLRYPGDPSAPIKETANCGCTLVPARRKKASA